MQRVAHGPCSRKGNQDDIRPAHSSFMIIEPKSGWLNRPILICPLARWDLNNAFPGAEFRPFTQIKYLREVHINSGACEPKSPWRPNQSLVDTVNKNYRINFFPSLTQFFSLSHVCAFLFVAGIFLFDRAENAHLCIDCDSPWAHRSLPRPWGAGKLSQRNLFSLYKNRIIIKSGSRCMIWAD